MEKYRVVLTNIVNDDIVVKMIVNKEQKIMIEHLYDHECFDPNLDLQITPDDNNWKEFC